MFLFLFPVADVSFFSLSFSAVFTDTSCSNAAYVFAASDGSCHNYPTVAGANAWSSSCNSATGNLTFTFYSLSYTCTGTFTKVSGAGGQCSQVSGLLSGQSFQGASCNPPFTTTTATTTTTKTTTTQTTASTAATTTTVSPTSSPSQAACFHKDTQILYKGALLMLSDFQKGHSECTIPHVVVADGVRIFTKDDHVLRLTNDHLVFTSRGLVAAGELLVGEKLFKSLSEDTSTVIVKISRETGQSYFGLNCLESVVLASSIKTSTFGSYHSVPAFWMRVAGKILGIQTASSIGDRFATLLAKAGLV